MKPADWALKALGWLLILFFVALAGHYYPQLPYTTPTHFGSDSQPNDYGPKYTLLLVPAIATVLFAGIGILNRFPHIFKYPVTIAPESTAKHYASAQRLMRLLNCTLVALFCALG